MNPQDAGMGAQSMRVSRALMWAFCLQASGDYIGMAVVDGQLRCVYNLGDREAELQVEQTLTRSETQEAVMDRVKFQRYSADRPGSLLS